MCSDTPGRPRMQVVKLDVEAAELVVLQRIIDGCHQVVDTLAFEGVTPGWESNEASKFRKPLTALGIVLRAWA